MSKRRVGMAGYFTWSDQGKQSAGLNNGQAVPHDTAVQQAAAGLETALGSFGNIHWPDTFHA